MEERERGGRERESARARAELTYCQYLYHYCANSRSETWGYPFLHTKRTFVMSNMMFSIENGDFDLPAY